MNLIFSDYCKFLKDKCGLELEEGYYWLDKQIIKCFDRNGEIHKLYRLKVADDLSMSYSIPKGYSMIGKEEIETWHETVLRNKNKLEQLECNAIKLVKDSIEKYKNYEYVSLTSGGKDSSVTMHLVRSVLPESKAIFNNTSLDCADVYRHIKTVPHCETINPKEGFYQWRKRIDFIPTRFGRACCTIFKEGAMVESLDNNKKYLFFMGMRNQESANRSSYGDEWHNNKWNDNWNAILPIRKWSELDVWLYILFRNISISDKYKKGYSRVGCAIACPYATKSTWILDQYWYPKMYLRWQNILKDDFIRNKKSTLLNCTLDEYCKVAWNGGRYRDEPTQEVIDEFMKLSGISSKHTAMKYFNSKCSECDKPIKKDNVGLSMKLLGRNTKKLLCNKCLGKQLKLTKDEIKQEIAKFKSQGCELF